MLVTSVHPNGPGCLDPWPYAIVGESPGKNEDRTGIPFIGMTGKTQDIMLQFCGLDRSMFFLSHVVRILREADDFPNAEDIAQFSEFLLWELEQIKPQVIAAVGSISTKWFLGPKVSVMKYHGIAFRWPLHPETIVVPVMQPSFAMRTPKFYDTVFSDYEELARTIAGKSRIHTLGEPRVRKTQYEDSRSRGELTRALLEGVRHEALAVDTETVANSIFSASVSWEENTGLFIHKDDHEVMQALRNGIALADTVPMHNAKYDLMILKKYGIEVPSSKVADTMLMTAHVNVCWPRGLKPTAYHRLDILMSEYSDTVRDATTVSQVQYLRAIEMSAIPKPDSYSKVEGGALKIKKPTALQKRAAKILGDVMTRGIKSDENEDGVDIRDRWNQIKKQDGRRLAEQFYGPMPEGTVAEVPQDKLVDYACEDADATLQLYRALRPEIVSRKKERILAVDTGSLSMLADMEARGILLDVKRLQGDLGDRVYKMLNEQAVAIYTYAQGVVNPNSHKDIKKLLYDLDVFDSPDQSTNQKYLKAVREKHPIVNAILKWREANKLITTYIDTLPDFVDEYGVIHPDFNPLGTQTGRLSCVRPNLMNQPVRSELGKEIRNCYIARPGFTLVSTDYSQIEMRYAAYKGNDAAMCDIFRRGADVHAETASRMFGIPLEQVDEKKHRYPAKRTGFGTLYGIGGPGLYEQYLSEGIFTFTAMDCTSHIRKWFAVYTGIAAYMEQAKKFAYKNARIFDDFGRERYAAKALAMDKKTRAEAMRESANMPIQSGAQAVIKVAMKNLYQNPDIGYGDVTFPLLQIHDEILWEVREDAVDDVIPNVLRIMAAGVKFENPEVPIKADAEVGHEWGAMKGWKKMA